MAAGFIEKPAKKGLPSEDVSSSSPVSSTETAFGAEGPIGGPWARPLSELHLNLLCLSMKAQLVRFSCPCFWREAIAPVVPCRHSLLGRNLLQTGSPVQAGCEEHCQACSLSGIYIWMCQLFSIVMHGAFFLPRSNIVDVFRASILSFGIYLQG